MAKSDYKPINTPKLSLVANLPGIHRFGIRRMDSGLSHWDPNPARLLLLKKCHDLLKQRLTGATENLFWQLTGLSLHVTWHQPLSFQKIRLILPAVCCPTAQRRRKPNGELPASCGPCLQKHWTVTAQTTRGERRFVEACGLSNFSVGIHAGNDSPLLTLCLQAQIKGQDSERRARTFERAVGLLRLIHRDLRMTLQASIARSVTGRLERRLTILAMENTKLRQQRPSRPGLSAATAHQSADSRAEQIVQKMVAYVHKHYHRPMSLGQVAAALKMNAAYLCDLFSRTLGVTFHQYVTELRMTKAKELLREPHRRVCEVACAVGYASADQFRHTFKTQVGVPPSGWR